jgi:hypothetical protein
MKNHKKSGHQLKSHEKSGHQLKSQAANEKPSHQLRRVAVIEFRQAFQ